MSNNDNEIILDLGVAGPVTTGVFTYSANNSGGDWWLTDEDWVDLEKAGWVVHWYHSSTDDTHTHEGPEAWMVTKGYSTQHSHSYATYSMLTKVQSDGSRWLGALATSASKATNDPKATLSEWAEVTGQNYESEGCSSCGAPHSFYYRDASGNETWDLY